MYGSTNIGTARAEAARLGSVFAAVILLGAAVPQASALGFVQPYALGNFTLFDNGHYNVEATVTDSGSALQFIGPDDGSGLDGYSDLIARSAGSGRLLFDFLYTCDDSSGTDYAGYLVNDSFYPLVGDSGNVSVALRLNDSFGFRLGSDNQGGPGILTVTNFSAPVPEPGALGLAMIGILFIMMRRAQLGKRGAAAGKMFASIAAAALALAAVPLWGQGQVDYTGTSATGQMQWQRVVNLRQQSQTPLAFFSMGEGGEKQPRAALPRLRPPVSRSLAVGGQLGAGAAPLHSLVVSPSAATGFNALSHRDQRLAYAENQFSVEPPSTSVAVGNGYLLEGVNNAVQVYSLTGSPALPAVVATNQLFGVGPAIDWNTSPLHYGVYLTDMRVYYDQGINRWFVVQRSQDNDIYGNYLNKSHLYLAVSKTGDPTGDYNIYVMETTNSDHPGCPCIADYPQIGSDQYGFHIAWNEFSPNSYYFVDASILSLSKAALAAGSPAPNAYQFFVPYTTGYEFAIQPASTPPGASNFLAAGGLEYFVSSLSRSAYSSSVALWSVRNTSSLATPSANLVLSRIIVPTLPYTFPDVAIQRPGPLQYGSSFLPARPLAYLDGGDTRIQSLSYAAARLFLTLQSGVTDENNHFVVGGAYVVLTPAFRNNLLSASVLNQGYLMMNGNHLLRPAIAVNPKGRGAISVTLTGPEWFPSAALIPFDTLATPATIEVAALGELPEDGFTGYPDFGGTGVARWGDYNSAVAASDGSIWLAAEYIGNFLRTDYANWNTYIFRRLP
ncbi:MAG: PEP-CTERM sorting domain-containing protein [Acidobacteriia bacterium]|nr:PEP-CTERM sorting domain-containing protein [Terriglobia bacterium]